MAIGLALGSLATMGFVSSDTLLLQPESRIWVKGSSTVRDYTCNAKTIAATIEAASAETAALPLDQLVSSAQVSVAVAGLECGNGTMNEHMRKALKANEYPQLEFALAGYQIVDAGNVTLKGDLTMAGRTLPIEISGTITELEGGLIRVAASKQLKMTEWAIKPPSLMLGTLKVHDPVTIGLDILIKR
jgi:polyisoprenoid-binding protein YceI